MTTQTHPSRASRSPAGWRKAVLFRGAALLVGLLPFLLLEVGLRLAGWGLPAESEDPYVGFSGAHPLFVLNEQAGRYEIPRSRHEFFRPESFAAEKSPDEFRIFCLGGSTVQGRPYAIQTSFTTWLEIALHTAAPDRKWEVVNCGGVSYASYRLAPLLEEMLAHEPDLFIVYTGHNEFLEDRTYQHVKETPALLREGRGWLSRLRTYAVLRSLWLDWTGQAAPSVEKPVLPAEVDALLDYRGGLADYHRDDAWREGAIEHFEYNLRRMIATAQQAGVPLVLCNPVCNLRDCPPFKIAPGDELSDDARQKFASLWNDAREVGGDDLARQEELLTEAIRIDSRHAGAHFLLGKCYEAQGDWQQARACFLRAKREDICPLRMIEPMHEVLFQVAEETGTPLVDIRSRFAADSEGGIVGEDWLLDHVHPSIHGHQRIAHWIFAELSEQGIAPPAADWGEIEERYREHLEELDLKYFVRGEERLEGLRRWTQGRSRRVRKGAASEGLPKRTEPAP